MSGARMRRSHSKAVSAERILIGCVLLLIGFSILMVYSASLSVAEVRYHDSLRIIRHWLLYVPAGLGVMWLVARVDGDWWKALALPLLGIALLLMLAVFVPGLGREINGARRWLAVGGLTLQPVELLKPAVVIYMAYYLSSFPERLRRFSIGLAPMLSVLALALLLLLMQPDFGSAALLAAVCFCMWFVGGVPMRHLLGVLAASVPLMAIVIVSEPYRVERLLSFIDPWRDPFDSGYQLVQSMIAFGSGGVFGVGLGQGVQKLFYLPEVFTDFIAACIAEELGLPGTLGLIIVFAVLIGSGLWLAMRLADGFSRLVTLGCILFIGFAFMINLGAAMGIMPTKGMPMPFLSYGGSALIGECILIGLILSARRGREGGMDWRVKR